MEAITGDPRFRIREYLQQHMYDKGSDFYLRTNEGIFYLTEDLIKVKDKDIKKTRSYLRFSHINFKSGRPQLAQTPSINDIMNNLVLQVKLILWANRRPEKNIAVSIDNTILLPKSENYPMITNKLVRDHTQFEIKEILDDVTKIDIGDILEDLEQIHYKINTRKEPQIASTP